MKKTIIHRDNTVSYWDVYLQQYRERVDSRLMSDDTILSLPYKDRERVRAAADRATNNNQDINWQE